MNQPTFEDIIGRVRTELVKALAKHGPMPEDMIHCAGIVGEESGELIRAALQHTYEGASPKEMEKEAIQTAAMAIKFLMNPQFVKLLSIENE